jgi:bifunctional DNA-binding transcriptional regulator/antitoxin component of YhaV-PrlF toxin-antitoxin module
MYNGNCAAMNEGAAMYLTLTRNGQFTVNKSLMEHIGVKLGDPIAVRPMPDGSFSVTVRKKKRPLKEMRGAFRHIFGKVEPVSLEDIEKAISDFSFDKGAVRKLAKRGLSALLLQ